MVSKQYFIIFFTFSISITTNIIFFLVAQAREDTRSASRYADSADASAQRVRQQHEITKLNLKELRDKILLARQKASSVSDAFSEFITICFIYFKQNQVCLF